MYRVAASYVDSRFSNLSKQANTWLLKRWEECITTDIKRIKAKWQKKIVSTKKAFTNDKNVLREHQISQIAKMTPATDPYRPQDSNNTCSDIPLTNESAITVCVVAQDTQSKNPIPKSTNDPN